MPKARHQEWLRTHLEGLPERQRAREQARREKARRQHPRREGAGIFPGPKPWASDLTLRPVDVWRGAR